ncbi:hypothetical protein FRC17_004411 [Serendipita sp. 399]|nr:hypothetical protein FRC17_004411 [Serendipita sp. 399]
MDTLFDELILKLEHRRRKLDDEAETIAAANGRSQVHRTSLNVKHVGNKATPPSTVNLTASITTGGTNTSQKDALICDKGPNKRGLHPFCYVENELDQGMQCDNSVQ